jgi:hypothetical protein
MKRAEFTATIKEIEKELGTLPVQIVTEKEFYGITGTRIAGAPYKICLLTEKDTKPIVAIKFRDRSELVVKRFLYQAIAEILWKTVSYPEKRWIGLVMAGTGELPRDATPYKPDYTRTKALKLLTSQIKRLYKTNSTTQAS